MAYVSSSPADTGDECFLCAAASGGGDQSLVVGRGRLAYLLMNRFPYTNGHLKADPVRHTLGVLTLTEEGGAAVFAATQRAVRVLIDAPRHDGFNIRVKQGGALGESAEHV